MQSFIVGILIKVLTDPEVGKVLRKLFGDLFNDLITKKFSPLIPLSAASAAHAFATLIPGVPAAIEDVVTAANTVREDLNKVIPDFDIGIPLIDDILDAWRPKS